MAAPTIVNQQADQLERLRFSDSQDFEDANRGLVAPIEAPVVAEDGTVLRDDSTYDFLDGAAPAP